MTRTTAGGRVNPGMAFRSLNRFMIEQNVAAPSYLDAGDAFLFRWRACRPEPARRVV